MKDRYISSAEAQDQLGLCRDTVEKLIRTGKLTAFKAGDHRTSPYRISEASIDAYIKRQTVPSAAS